MVSVIVPVYNCEKYLQKCVDSILNQTHGALEIILVDDGSVDRSGSICDCLAQAESRIRVIHQKNSGVSAARNAGLDAAQGEYIVFVDADDTLVSDGLQKAVEAATSHGADVVLYDPIVQVEGQSGETVDSMPFFPESGAVPKEEITPERLQLMAGAVWRVMYQRELIERIGLRFDTALPLSEDRLFNLVAMGCCRKLYYLRQPIYRYWINAGSAVGRYRENLLQLLLHTHETMEQALQANWGPEYISVYERVNLVDGALLCVNNAFSRKNPHSFPQKYAAVKQVVNEPAIRQAYSKLPATSLRQKLVYHKCSLLLCVVGKLWNLKNGK